jgi:thioesterase domain-containing protein
VVSRPGYSFILDADLANPGAIAVSDEALTFCTMIRAQFGYVPALTSADPDPEARMLEPVRRRPGLAQKLENWRSFVDGPIESVELDWDHRLMLLPEPVARIRPTLTERLARAAVMPVREGSGGGTP